MPLHLLGKKSWNVYNQDNIARVRRDEAEARVREEEQDRRMQEVDSERRLQLLQGLKPDSEPHNDAALETQALRHDRKEREGYSRKRRRIAGEDDTDREIRYAKEDAEDMSVMARGRGLDQDSAPIVDSVGHINLIPEHGRKFHEKNAEAESEKAQKRREYENQYTMRFSNAAGYKEPLDSPWYSANGVHSQSMPSKDVWGNEDPRRKEREKARIDSNDPLMAMKKGVKELKDAEKQRKQWIEERQKEMTEIEYDLGRKRRHDHHHHHRDEEDQEEFTLEEPSKHRRHRHHRHSSKPRRHSLDGRRTHRHRHQSRHRSPPQVGGN